MIEEYLQLSVPADKIVKIPNGVDWKRFQDNKDHALLRNRLGLGVDLGWISTEDISPLFFYEFYHQLFHGVIALLEAFDQQRSVFNILCPIFSFVFRSLF